MFLRLVPFYLAAMIGGRRSPLNLSLRSRARDRVADGGAARGKGPLATRPARVDEAECFEAYLRTCERGETGRRSGLKSLRVPV